MSRKRYLQLREQHRCVRCSVVLPPSYEHVYCSQCLKHHRRYRKSDVTHGICYCGNPLTPPYRHCLTCRERARIHSAEQRAAYQAAGLCVCGNARVDGYNSCARCLAYFQNRYKTRDDKLTDQRKQSHAKYVRARRSEILEHYGGKCACCGETASEFLQVDHPNNDGAEHRREIGKGRFYHWLKEHNFPPDFRLLCANCNWSRGKWGYCPHEREKGE